MCADGTVDTHFRPEGDPARAEAAQSPAGGVPAQRRAGWRRWAGRVLIMMIAPAALVALVEGALRIAGSGYPTGFLVRAPDGDGWIGNECFAWRFTSREGAPVPQPLLLRAKQPGTIRVFVLGESAAMGVPEPAFGLARMLRAMLRAQYPDRQFEVVNAAVMGINSHAIRPIARQLVGFEPDAFVIYMGNNELCGFAGPMTVGRGQPLPAVEAVRFSLWLKSTRTGQAVHSLLAGDRRVDAQEVAAFLEHQVTYDEARRKAVAARFARNLGDTLDAIAGSGAPAVVCTVGVNLRDCSPLGSMHRRDLSDADRARFDDLCRRAEAAAGSGEHAWAVQLLEQALAIDEAHAAGHWRLAHALLASGQADRARCHFVRARDLDTLPFRADSSINAAIREVTAARAAAGARLVDAEAAFAAAAADGVPGSELFYEHVHMTFDGNHVLAAAVMPVLCEALAAKAGLGRPAAAVPSRQRCAELLALTPLGELRMAEPMRRLMCKPPFTNQFDNVRMRRLWNRRVDELSRRVAATGDDAMRAPLEAALARDGEDWMLRCLYADVLSFIGERSAAVEQMRKAMALMPHASAIRQLLSHALLADGRPGEARECIEAALRHCPHDPAVWKTLGDILAVQKQPQEALAAYRRALQLKREQVDVLRAVAAVLVREGRIAEAEAELRSGLAGRPLRMHRALADLHTAAGAADKALDHRRRALRLAPDDSEVRMELAHALARAGRTDEAIEHFRLLIRDEPDNVAAYTSLAAVFMGAGRTAEAADWHRRALAVRPDASAHYNLGTLAFMDNRLDEAENHFRAAVRLDLRMPAARHNLGSLLFTRGRNDEAIRHLNEAVRLDPTHAAAHMMLGQALARDRKPDLAARHFRKALELGAREAPVLVGLARILAAAADDSLRNGREAVSLAEEACEKTGYRSPVHLDVLAAAHAEAGDFGKAAHIATRAAELAAAAGNRALAQEARARAEMYRAGRPWRLQ